MIALPRRICLDTSTLNKLAGGVYGEDGESRESANLLLSRLNLPEHLTTLCVHHVQELAAHGDPKVVVKRLRILERLEQTAWVRPVRSRETMFQGSVFDLRYRELVCALEDPALSLPEVAKEVRKDCFITKTQAQVDLNEIMKIDVAMELGDHRRKDMEALSLMHAHALVFKPVRLRDFLEKQTIYSGTSAVSALLRQKDEFLEKMERVKDPALEDWEQQANAFWESQAQQLRLIGGIGLNPKDCLARWLAQFGMTLEDVDLSWDTHDVARLWQFRGHATSILKARNWEGQADLSMELSWRIPSWVLEQELFLAAHKREDASKGSDKIDFFLACLGLYTDVLTVDRRTSELIRQARAGNPELDQAMGTVIKGHDLLHELGEETGNPQAEAGEPMAGKKKKLTAKKAGTKKKAAKRKPGRPKGSKNKKKAGRPKAGGGTSKTDRIRTLLGTGMKAAEIAEKVGCSVPYVYVVKSKGAAKRGRGRPKGRGPGRPKKSELGGSLDGLVAGLQDIQKERDRLRAAVEKIAKLLDAAL